MSWKQRYDALGAWSAPVAALPIAVLLLLIASGRVRAPVAAAAALLVAFAVAIAGFGMPAALAWRAAAFGAAYGMWPIGWIVLNTLFLYRLSAEGGRVAWLREAVARITPDRRLQLLLVAFCLGAFLEGAAGFGAPVTICGALLVALGFAPERAAVLALIANTAPVAFGALGIQTIALAGAAQLPLAPLTAMAGRLVAPFCLLVPVWLLVADGGWRRAAAVWPAVAVVGGSYAAAVLMLSAWHGPWLAAIVPALVSAGALLALLRWWHPAVPWPNGGAALPPGAAVQRAAWAPWALLVLLVFLSGLPAVRQVLDMGGRWALAVPGLDGAVRRAAPLAVTATPEAATFVFNPWSATGTAILIAGVAGGIVGGETPRTLARHYRATVVAAAPALATIAAMLALGSLTRFAGLDGAIGLAFAGTGGLYPWFGTMLGWVGTAATGSDTASNVLFGSLQRLTAEQLALSPILMAAANSVGGTMGKMVDAQSIVVAAIATGIAGREGRILRRVAPHSLALAALVGLWVAAVAFVPPFKPLLVR